MQKRPNFIFIIPSVALVGVIAFYPYTVHALGFSSFTEKVKQIFVKADAESDLPEKDTSQTMALFKPVVVNDSELSEGESRDASSSGALQAVTGPMRVSTEDIDFPTNDLISIYEVKNGDTLQDVAKLFGVSKNTIIWANDLKSEKLIPGDTLVILPMSGIRHTIKKGDTVASVAKKYKADEEEIANFNGISEDTKLAVGDTILVPDGEITVTQTKKAVGGKISKSKILEKYINPTSEGFLIRPLIGGVKTQGIHGHNAVDIAATPGTPVIASANGKVIAAKVGGYNGGYGNMVIIMHDGNIQTVYAHLRTVTVSTGQEVARGAKIGEVGTTGRSTGPHLHFEVRGAKNPF